MTARTATPCPRCDYDLSGARDSWTDSCPLEGRCPECGLDIRWSEVLNPALTYPRWSFEHARDRLPRRLIETLARTLWPWGFWRALRMEHPIVWRRLFLLAVCWAAVIHCGIGMCTSIKAVGSAFVSAWALNPSRAPTTIEVVASVLGWIVWPYRTGTSSILGVRGVGTLVLNQLLVVVVVLCPLAFAPLGDTLRTARVRRAHLWRAAAYSATPIAIVMICSGLLCVASACEEYNLIVLPSRGAFPDSYSDLVELAATLSLLAVPLWLLVFWWAACKRYLRIPHALGVAIAVVTIAVLSPPTVVMMIARLAGAFGQ